jgi:integrase/recombinase XerD
MGGCQAFARRRRGGAQWPPMRPEIQALIGLEGEPVPLERLAERAKLDGSEGGNRARGLPAQISAVNDLEAIRVWLGRYRDSPNTLRSYRKEAERLVLWALIEAGQPLSSLAVEDIQVYEAFLDDPQPRSRWCGRVFADRTDPAWKPFRGPLSKASKRQAMVILEALFDFLVEAGYLRGNPVGLARRKSRTPARGARTERYLSKDLWQLVMEHVESLPANSQRQRNRGERLRVALTLLYFGAPRVAEAAAASMADLSCRDGPDGDQWWWKIIGKGGKEGWVPVTQILLNAINRYRVHLGLARLPRDGGEDRPLIPSVSGKRHITPGMLYRLVKGCFAQVADTLEQRQPGYAERLRHASTHWLRHTSATHQLDAGVELRHVSQNLRHASLATTASIYIHTEDDARHRDTARLRASSPPKES